MAPKPGANWRSGRAQTAPALAFVGHVIKAASGPPTNLRLRHCNIVVSISSAKIHLASVCTFKPSCDESCIIEPGDLPGTEIRHTSFVDYERIWSVGHAVYKGIVEATAGAYVGRTPANTLVRVLEGLVGTTWIDGDKKAEVLGERPPSSHTMVAGARINFQVQTIKRRALPGKPKR